MPINIRQSKIFQKALEYQPVPSKESQIRKHPLFYQQINLDATLWLLWIVYILNASLTKLSTIMLQPSMILNLRDLSSTESLLMEEKKFSKLYLQNILFRCASSIRSRLSAATLKTNQKQRRVKCCGRLLKCCRQRMKFYLSFCLISDTGDISLL